MVGGLEYFASAFVDDVCHLRVWGIKYLEDCKSVFSACVPFLSVSQGNHSSDLSLCLSAINLSSLY